MSMIGKSLIHYEISAQIGRGGMGEVYQAKDTKLGRDVAIKILPEEFARDADRVARFQREAKLLASLNHPNIAAIHGLEESNGINFLVMELIEGSTLADRIKTGPIPVEETLKLALQIAEALEAAHEKGVIHRDLKPANIKITPDGRIKILDFGLAKAFAEDQGEEKPLDSPTLSDAATRKGIILGTAAYMSPEQARGKPVDRRADIWAFGVILFEMLTGRALFEGEDVTSTLARVLEREPDYSALNANLHPRIRFLLERCLEKDPGNRCSSISDARVEMQKVLADPGGVYPQPFQTLKPRKKLQAGISWIAVTAIICVIIAGILGWNFRAPVPPQTIRFEYELPADQKFLKPAFPSLAVSPDGKQFIYCTPEGLRVRSIGEFNSRLLPGTELALEPCFSPDGQWICYYSEEEKQLKKISVTGGAPVPLTKTSSQPFGSPSWSENDWIVYAVSGTIMRVPANGGTPETLLREEQAVAPQILPGGKSVLFTSGRPFKVVVQSLESGERRELFEGNTASYLQTGHIVYMLENNLFAIAFDPSSLDVKGGPILMVEDILEISASQYAVSQSGTLVYVNNVSFDFQIAWVDKEGREELIEASPAGSLFPAISPDGRKIAVTLGEPGDSDLWIFDLNRETSRRLTLDTTCAVALWNPDGKGIAYGNEKDLSIYWRSADGTGEPKLLASVSDRRLYPWSWADNGKTLIMEDRNGEDIGMLSMEGEGEWTPLLAEEYGERQPQVSPDGRWIAYISEESGQDEVYVRPFPEVENGKEQVSRGGGNSPLWAPEGNQVYYRNGDAVMAVAIETGKSLSLGSPRLLFNGGYFSAYNVVGPVWDISPDGKRFLMVKSMSAGSEIRKIKIVLNWSEELKQRVPVD